MSIILKAFYKDMQAWIQKGCGEHSCFKTSLGLCANLIRWAKEHGIKEVLLVTEKQGELFAQAGLSRSYPFNDRETNHFIEETDHYKNEQRLMWVKQHS